MAKARQLPSGNWHVKVYDYTDENGKRHYRAFTEATEREANKKAELFKEHKKALSKDSGNMTLNEAMDSFIEARSNILSPSTIRGYRKIQQERFKELIGVRLNDLTEETIQKAVNRESKKYAPKTVINAYGFVATVLNVYRKGFKPDILLPQRKKFIPQRITAEDIRKLMLEIQKDSLSAALLLAIVLGLRRSEIIALYWEDINFNLQTLTVKRAMVRDENENLVIKDTTKTEQSTRTIHIPKFILDELEAIIPEEANGHIFKVNPETILAHLKKCCDLAGIPRLRLHDLRHIMASVGLMLNIGDKYLMERGGWSSKDVMKNVYQHTLYEGASQAELLIENYFESLIEDKNKPNE
ncbi:tyrosine-type recombinase/integrase [Bacilliculturomica massiliensis]|uniref:tyrosine-type recombinase/integrase n=1 Tax=Bacilliculturomica massiliensis TaxID=1917867 RepID=UPI001030B1DB|nr:tyrosine-type recombinase/integrase [Bacilliculturomica massiliensis]